MVFTIPVSAAAPQADDLSSVAYIYAFDDLTEALSNPIKKTFILMNDIEMTDTLEIGLQPDFSRLTAPTSAQGLRHFDVHIEDGGEVVFAEMILDGAGQGGGVAVYDTDLTFRLQDVHFENCSNVYGGAIYVEKGAFQLISDAVRTNTISGNTAVYGGGIYIDPSCENAMLTGRGPLSIANNTAASGGAVYIEDLAKLTVNESFRFAGNQADTGYFMTDAADIALHEANIQTTYFSAPFTEYSYNNFDISYTKGIQLED